ncbi:hypothetical protein KC356_g3184 [Hortaea werneckii]|nr:hypothetical protein KC356_g3184 [Hortaea werneckii]
MNANRTTTWSLFQNVPTRPATANSASTSGSVLPMAIPVHSTSGGLHPNSTAPRVNSFDAYAGHSLSINTLSLKRGKRQTVKQVFKDAARKISSVLHGRIAKVNTCKATCGFLLPSDHAAADPTLTRNPSRRSSVRSRRSLARMSFNPPNPDRNSSPSITLTTTTSFNGGNKRQTLTLHSADNSSSQPMPQPQKAIRFSHPAVNAVISAPATPMSFFSNGSDPVSYVGSIDVASVKSSVIGSPVSIEFAGQVDAKKIQRLSFAGAPGGFIEGDVEQLRVLRDKLDGCSMFAKIDHEANLSSRTQTHSASTELPYIAPFAALDIEEQSNAGASADADVEAEREKHRTAALAALESPALPTSTTGKSVGNKNAHPDSLIPGQLPTARPVKRVSRPYTTDGVGYIAYSKPFNPYNEPETPTSGAAEVGATDTTSDDGSVPSFADAASHKAHYSRIESGIFSPITSSIPRPANPTPPDSFSTYFVPSPPTVGGLQVPPAMPPSSPHQSAYNATPIKRKPVTNFSRRSLNRNKPLPATPGPMDPRRFTNGVFPSNLGTPYLNENGYPMLSTANTNSSNAAAVTPGHKRRTPHPGEAKANREQTAKTAAKQRKVEQKGKAGTFVQQIGKALVCGL